MQFNLNQDVLLWLDSVRGTMSRQAYIAQILRQQMQNTIHTKEQNDSNVSNGAIDALS